MINLKKQFLLITIIVLALVLTLVSTFIWHKKPIRVGILHSLTGTMAISEKPVVNATLLAIKELNDQGGLLGRKIVPVVVDGQSNNSIFAQKVEQLIIDKKVDAIFGCWTSACRKTIKPIVERHNHIFFYPVQYEGLEQSSNIVYTGATPNQQIIPALRWAMENLGKSFFLVGSDYVFPRAANQIIHDVIDNSTSKVVGEEYIPLGSKEVSLIIDKIIKSKPDVIINSINGDSNVAFFEQLYQQRSATSAKSAKNIPVISLSIGESELQHLDKKIMQGHYSVFNYFQSIDNDQNKRFITNYQQQYGANSVTSDPMESAYISVYLWAKAVKTAGSVKPEIVLQNIKGQGILAPEGMITIDPSTLHSWKTVRIAQVNKKGEFSIMWNSIHAIKPVPFPNSRSQQQWLDYLDSLFQQWNSQWENRK